MTRTYITTKRLTALGVSLTNRQRHILTTLDRVRLASTTQLERLHFPDVTKRQARRLLTQMTTQRLIQRLPRAIGGPSAGSAGHIYSLDRAGLRLLRPPGASRYRPWSVGWPFLKHSLAITELYVQLIEAQCATGLTLVEFITEPRCWRRFAGPGGGRVTLKPDAYVVTRVGDFEDHWFVELDLGTEAVTTLSGKCEVYRRYRQSGAEQAKHEIFPRVLFVVPDERRHDTLVDVFARQPADSWQLFAVVLSDEAVNRIARGADV